MSVSSFSSGITPASLSLVALIRIMNRMGFLLFLVFGNCLSVGTTNESGENDKRSDFLRDAF